MKTPWPIVLASTSPYRAQLLGQLGWAFSTAAPAVDEGALKGKGIAPADLALELSKRKALDVFEKHPGSCVIGSDQVCCIGDEIFSKPGDHASALRQLKALQGKAHQLLTAVTVLTPEDCSSFLNTTTLHMRDLEDEEIERYLRADAPYGCAGSYMLEAHGIRLFERIEMEDHTAIIGLPLIQLTNTLIHLGYSL